MAFFFIVLPFTTEKIEHLWSKNVLPEREKHINSFWRKKEVHWAPSVREYSP